ncbi:MAG: isopenicillin N synthase family oxygenase [Alteromonadaceae bacterium]|nr:isopenicillin N synthase family oxygenase [Alteromonadaceae bacterium]
MSLPVIPFYQHTDPGLAIHHALSELGFMQVSDFGIDKALLSQVYSASREFFCGASEVKRRCRYRSAQENFGYQGIAEENLDPDSPADLKETFTMRNILHACPAEVRWPSLQFKQLMQQFYANVLDASTNLQKAMAVQLGVEETFFTRVNSGENISLRLLYYPAQQAEQVAPSQLGAGAHTDYGFMTLLFQDNVGGLQVLNKQNNWMDVPPLTDTVVVNSGDLLERWTNGLYRSTLHRVKPQTSGRDRLSIAMFIDPDSQTSVVPLPSCVSNQRPAQFSATTAGEHIQSKLNATHKSRFTQ